MVKAGNKGTYKCTGAENNKVCGIHLYKNLPTSQNKSFANGYYSGTFLHCQNGGMDNKILSHLAKEICQYLLAIGIMITVEYLLGTLSVDAGQILTNGNSTLLFSKRSARSFGLRT